MKIQKIKPIPKYILKSIQKADKRYLNNPYARPGTVRFYSYLAKNDGELVKIIVACKNNINSTRWRCKQVAIHGIHSNFCFIKDIVYNYLSGYSVGWFDEGLQKEQKWYEDKEWGIHQDKYFNIYCPILNIDYALKFPEYKYSAIDKYPYCDTFKYLRLYEQYPQAEMLVKFGLSAYATKVQLLKKIGTDKAFRKWLANNKDEIHSSNYYVYTIINAYTSGKPLKQIQNMERDKKDFSRHYAYTHLKTMFNTKEEITELIKYVNAQQSNLSAYDDYIRACNYLGLDVSLPKNRFPHNFQHWHDIRIDEYHTAKALKDAEERKELYAKFATVAEKYLPLQKNDTLAIKIALSPQDLIYEGDALHHCVGHMNYDQRFIREESLIFFVRNIDEPNKPFVTLEYSPSQKKVLQCYGEHDTKPSETVLKYVYEKWLPYANKQLKKLQSKIAQKVA